MKKKMISYYKVILFGEGGVGKSSITTQYVFGRFDQEYDPNIEDNYTKKIEVDGITSTIDVIDTAGTEEFSAMRDHYMREGYGFLLIFSITDKKSFEDIDVYRDQLCRVRESEDFPILLIGNKSDLEDERVISKDEAQKLAKKWNGDYIESSAKKMININESFVHITRLIYKSQGLYPEEKKKEENCALF